jgi:hypothetical protein
MRSESVAVFTDEFLPSSIQIFLLVYFPRKFVQIKILLEKIFIRILPRTYGTNVFMLNWIHWGKK